MTVPPSESPDSRRPPNAALAPSLKRLIPRWSFRGAAKAASPE